MRKVRIALIGGGSGSFIGNIHRMAMRLDGYYEICAGALSSDYNKSLVSGEEIGIPKDRIYNNYEELITAESFREDGAEVVSIVTPNHVHFGPAKMALEKGLSVIVDKPLCLNTDEASELKKIAAKSKGSIAVTYTYGGYPAIVEAKELVKTGALGKLKKIHLSYPQGWLSKKIENENQKQASWRTDPKQAGISCTFADIGSHAVQMAENVSGQHVTKVLAELNTFVDGRSLDDDATVLLKFSGGLKGLLMASQICTGENNGFSFSLYGENGGLHWSHNSHTQLKLEWSDKPTQILEMGVDKGYLSEKTRNYIRTPAGHPEGYIEAFANIYKSFAEYLRNNTPYDFADVEDGASGMAVVEAVVESSKDNSWQEVKKL